MSYISIYDIYNILVEFYLFLATCIILIYSIYSSNNIKLGYPLIIQIVSSFVFLTLIFSFLLALLHPLFLIFSWNYLLISDDLTYKLRIFLLLFALGWSFLASFYLKKEQLTSFEYWILILLTLIAMLILLQVYDFLSLYLTIELQSLIFYILISFKRTSEFSTEAGLKYFILSAFSSTLLLFGSSLLYSLTGLTNFGDLTKFFTGFTEDDLLFTMGATTSLIFLCITLLFKLSVAPFHMWSPDVYEGAPTITTAFLVIMPKIPLLTLFIRLYFVTFHQYSFIVEKLLLISAILSLFIGAFGALIQKKWKRFIAYSSINHMGFILLALLIGDNLSFLFTLFYTIIYILTMLHIFSFLISYRTHIFLNNYQTRYLNNIKALAVINPILALSLALSLFSMAGIPPLAGFFAKMFILFNLLKNNFYGIAILAILSSCLTCFYYIKIIKTMYFSFSTRLPMLYPIDKFISLLLACSLFFLCLAFLDLDFIILILQNFL